jgi:hypothetical protein
MPQMLGAASLPKEKELVWAQSSVLPANKALFLRPVPEGQVRTDHPRTIKSVSSRIVYS